MIQKMTVAVMLTVMMTSTVLAIPHSGGGSHSTRGYTKKNGTQVAPHKQTNPDKSKSNNWSTKDNVNPNTGKKGTVNPNSKK